jgi:hypothetical protein
MKQALRIGFSLFLAIGFAWSQDIRATLTGAVIDPQGAVVPNARIEIRNHGTNVVINAVTSDAGLYVVPDLNPGQYSVTASAGGFKSTVRDNIELRVADRKTIDIKLEIGSASENITITAEAPMLETGTAAGGTTINTQLVSDLPLVGGNPYALIQQVPGVSHQSAWPTQTSERPFDNGGIDGYSINGGLAGGNNNQFLLDGAPNNNNEGMGFVPPQGATAEVRTITNLYDAEYGRTGGGIATVTLKSGTNAFHGSAGFDIRNEKLNANLWQANLQGLSKPIYRWQQPDLSLTGAVIIPKLYNGRNKTFFLFAWEELRDKYPATSNRVFPTPLEASGDFSRTIGGNGNPIQIYDPLTTQCDANGLNCTRTPFPNSTVPASRIDPLIANLTKFYAAPQFAAKRGATNFIAQPNPKTDLYDSFTTRLDQNISDRNRLFATFVRGNRHETINNVVQSDPVLENAYPATLDWRMNVGATVDVTTTISSSMISDAHVNFLRHNGFASYPATVNFDPTSLGYSKQLAAIFQSPGFPAFSASGYSGLGSSAGLNSPFENDWSAGETITKIRGNHSLKFGGVATVTQRNSQVTAAFPGIASFTATFTQANPLGAADPNSGDAIATALLGYPNASSFTPALAYAYSTRYYAAFVQDDWRVTSKLTLNLGLRYDYQTPMTERYDRQIIGFDPTVAYTLGSSTVHGGPVYADGSHRYPYQVDTNNVGPRFGLAYVVTPSIVLRGGYGISYAQAFTNGPNTGFVATTSSVQTSTDGSNRYPVLTNAATGAGLLAGGGTALFPSGLSLPPGRTLAIPTVGGSITFLDPDYRNPMVQQYNLGIEIQLPYRSVLSVEYNGSKTRDIGVSRLLDTVSLSQFLSLNTKLTSTVANPYGVQPGTSCLAASTISLQQSLFGYPQFCGITESSMPLGRLWYNALQTRYEKRLSHGLTTLVSFTWAKNLGATDYMNGSYDDVNNLRKVIQSIDQKLRLNITLTYRIPFKDGFSSNAALKALSKGVLGGWTVSGIATFQTGNYLSTPAGVWSTGVDPTKPTQYWSGPTLARWFNTCTITASGARQNCLGADEPAAWIIQPNQYVLQTLSPRLPNLRTLRPPVADVSIFKSFRIREGINFQLVGRAFNVGNTPWFGFGDNGAGITTWGWWCSFGQMNPSQGNTARQMSIVGKVTW